MNRETKIAFSHSLMVRTLRKNPSEIIASLLPWKMNVLHASVGISGEAGELLDAVKKAVIYNKQMDINNIIEELGDLEFYMEQLRQELGIHRETTLQANMDKLAIRYEGMKYSDEAAQARADKAADASEADFKATYGQKDLS